MMPSQPTHMRRALFSLGLLFPLVCLCASNLRAAQLRLTPGLIVEERYNDNIYFDTDSDYNIDDSITLISPELMLSSKTERLDAYPPCCTGRSMTSMQLTRTIRAASATA